MINPENVSNRLFDILLGHGNAIIMGDEKNKKTMNPNDAVRFYIKNKHSMVFYNRKDGIIELSVGNTEDLTSAEDLVKAVKNTAHHYNLQHSVKNFGKKLEPKDFAFQVAESANVMHGSTRSSYQTMPNARVIIRHTRAVNEEQRGARSRSISKIFIENAEGERFAYPFKYLAGARRLAEHVGQGGNPYDEQGQRLIKLAEQYITLRKFVSHANRGNFVNEATEALVKLAETRATAIGKCMATGRGLSEMTALVGISDASRIGEMQDRFTKKSVNKIVDSALPYVLELLDQQQLHEDTTNSVVELAAAIDAAPVVELSQMDASDSDHPKNLEFTNSDVRNKHIGHYLIKHLTNADLRAKLQELVDSYDRLSDDDRDTAAMAIRNLVSRAKVVKTEQLHSPSIEHQVLSNVSEAISKFTTTNILSR